MANREWIIPGSPAARYIAIVSHESENFTLLIAPVAAITYPRRLSDLDANNMDRAKSANSRAMQAAQMMESASRHIAELSRPDAVGPSAEMPSRGPISELGVWLLKQAALDAMNAVDIMRAILAQPAAENITIPPLRQLS